MSKKFKHLQVLAALCSLLAFGTGIESCSEPEEFCKHYSDRKDQLECSAYCSCDSKDARNPSFCASLGSVSRQEKGEIVRACQLGQLGYLTHQPQLSVSEAQLGCNRQYRDFPARAAACREGVTEEGLRISKSTKGAGSSKDRETGNNR